MQINIICLGKTRERWIQQGIDEYQKRLNPYWKISWNVLKDASLKAVDNIEKVKIQEAKSLLKSINTTDFVIALDENGDSISSGEFARKLENIILNKDVTFIIGGVYGLDKTVINRADLTLSLSRLTFPHQMVRVFLMEQLYRCRTIISGKSYHY